MKKYILVALLLAGCTTTQQEASAPTITSGTLVRTPTTLAWGASHPEWDIALRDAIKKSGLSNPEYIAQLMSIMTKYESGFDPKSVYHEPPPLGVDSIGLFQLSIESEKTLCGLKSKDQLKDPIININCAVLVFAKWVKKDGVMFGGKKGAWLGGSRYWSVLRTTSKSYPKIMKYMEGEYR